MLTVCPSAIPLITSIFHKCVTSSPPMSKFNKSSISPKQQVNQLGGLSNQGLLHSRTNIVDSSRRVGKLSCAMENDESCTNVLSAGHVSHYTRTSFHKFEPLAYLDRTARLAFPWPHMEKRPLMHTDRSVFRPRPLTGF